MTGSVIGACGASGTVPAGEEPSMSHTTLTVLVVLGDAPGALTRLLVRCQGRGWSVVSLRSAAPEVLMRLRVPAGRQAHVQPQIQRLVDVRQVVVDVADGLPDGVAFAAVRRKAPGLARVG
jgi:acetolactate synthase regulatory subunit